MIICIEIVNDFSGDYDFTNQVAIFIIISASKIYVHNPQFIYMYKIQFSSVDPPLAAFEVRQMLS